MNHTSSTEALSSSFRIAYRPARAFFFPQECLEDVSPSLFIPQRFSLNERTSDANSNSATFFPLLAIEQAAISESRETVSIPLSEEIRNSFEGLSGDLRCRAWSFSPAAYLLPL